MRRRKSLSLRGPAILLGLVIIFSVALTVLWNVFLVQDYNKIREATGEVSFHTTFIVIGSVLFTAIIVLSTVLGIQLFTNLRWRQRQANFIASVSHELNSPLGAIKLFGQTLRSEKLAPEERARFVEKILANVNRLASLISNILRAAEVDYIGEELLVDPGEVDLHAVLTEYVEDARTLHADKLEITLEGEPVWVELDALLFLQVLDNLVDNALRYRGDKPAHVALKLEVKGDQVQIDVTDSGVGIPRDRLESVFERFHRIGEGETQTGRRGVGIGLNVVRAIVRSHGGTVTAHSAGRDRGTTIRIRLPLLRRAEEVVA
ncbi:MAG: sensor histidine kinase [Planctomycetota bacterium]